MTRIELQEFPMLHSLRSAAKILNISQPTLWRRIKEGYIYAFQLPGCSKLYITEEELRNYLARAKPSPATSGKGPIEARLKDLPGFD